MNVDSNGNMVVSPISARGQERLARLRATIAQQFGGANTKTSGGAAAATTAMTQRVSRGLNMQQYAVAAHTTTATSAQQHRSKIRQRIEQASRMTSDEIFFKEFGSPKQLLALDFDLARVEHPRPRPIANRADPNASSANANVMRMSTTTQQSTQPSIPRSSSNAVRASATEALTRFDAIAQQISAATSAVRNTSTFHSSSRLAGAQESAAVSSYSAPHSTVRVAEQPAFVSQLQRPTRILTPKKPPLKRPRAAGEPPSAEKAPPAQKPRLLSDVTASFNNRSFSNVGHVRGSSGVPSSVNSPVRKASGFPRPTFLQQPSPSKFRVPPSTTRLFGQRQAPFR